MVWSMLSGFTNFPVIFAEHLLKPLIAALLTRSSLNCYQAITPFSLFF
jgi:hypothetical protein